MTKHPSYPNCKIVGHCIMDKSFPRFAPLEKKIDGRVRFTDVDMVTDIDGRIIVADWKSPKVGISKSGSKLLRSFTNPVVPIIGMVIWGDPQTMEIEEIRLTEYGRQYLPVPCTTEQYVEQMRLWQAKAENNETHEFEIWRKF